MLPKELLNNGWAIVDLSDRPAYQDRKSEILGVEDESGHLLCSYSHRAHIERFLAKHGVEAPHKCRFRKNGLSTAGNQQWRCKCGKTQMDGVDGRGRPRKYEVSTDRYKAVNRKKGSGSMDPLK